MSTKTLEIIEDKTHISSAEKEKGIENHEKYTMHLETAKNYHLEADRFNEIGDRELAFQSTIKAKEHLRLASEALKAKANYQAFNSETLFYR